MDDMIYRQEAIDACTEAKVGAFPHDAGVNNSIKVLKVLPSAEPEICDDGTMHISVSKRQLDKIGRVLVTEDGTTFCKQFYEDAEPERKRGKWIIQDNPSTGWFKVMCSECGEDFTSVIPIIGFFPNCKALWDYCPDCGSYNGGESE